MNAITYISQSSINSGEILSFLKMAWVTPIWKGKEMDNLVNYKPILLTRGIVKIVGRVMREKKLSF